MCVTPALHCLCGLQRCGGMQSGPGVNGSEPQQQAQMENELQQVVVSRELQLLKKDVAKPAQP